MAARMSRAASRGSPPGAGCGRLESHADSPRGLGGVSRSAPPAGRAAPRRRPGCCRRPGPPRPRRRTGAVDRGLHLHALQDDHRSAGLDLVARRRRRRETTSAGAGARTRPPSSRETRWATPSTSTRWSGAWATETTRCARPSELEPRREPPQALDVDVDPPLRHVHPVAARARSGRPRDGRARPRWRSSTARPDLVARLGAAAPGGGVEARALDRLLGLVRRRSRRRSARRRRCGPRRGRRPPRAGRASRCRPCRR